MRYWLPFLIGVSCLFVASASEAVAQRQTNSYSQGVEVRASMFGPRTLGQGIAAPRVRAGEQVNPYPTSLYTQPPVWDSLPLNWGGATNGPYIYVSPWATPENRRWSDGVIGSTVAPLRERVPFAGTPRASATELNAAVPAAAANASVVAPANVAAPMVGGTAQGQTQYPAAPEGEMAAPGEDAALAAQAAPVAPPVRPSIEWQTNYRVAGPAEQALARRLRETLDERITAPIQVMIAGGTVVLRGSVVSEEARAVAGHLARFEPGIRTVQNELTVAPPRGIGNR